MNQTSDSVKNPVPTIDAVTRSEADRMVRSANNRLSWAGIASVATATLLALKSPSIVDILESSEQYASSLGDNPYIAIGAVVAGLVRLEIYLTQTAINRGRDYRRNRARYMMDRYGLILGDSQLE